MSRDHRILGLPRDATEAAARAARRRLVRETHPDRAADPAGANSRLAEINAAFDRLKDRDFRPDPPAKETAPRPHAPARPPRQRPRRTVQRTTFRLDSAQQALCRKALGQRIRDEDPLLARLRPLFAQHAPGLHVPRTLVLEGSALHIVLPTPAAPGLNLVAFPHLDAIGRARLKPDFRRLRTMRLQLVRGGARRLSRLGGAPFAMCLDNAARIEISLVFAGRTPLASMTPAWRLTYLAHATGLQ